jgi:hypothetical protein
MPKRRVAEPTAEYVGRKKATNLSLTAEAIERGEQFAQAKDLSLSGLVDHLLTALPVLRPDAAQRPDPNWTEAVQRLYGAARGVAESPEEAVALYREYLYRKYTEQE